MTTQSITIIRLPGVLKIIGIGRSTVYDWINPKSPRYDPTFPRPIKLGQKSVGWRESDLNYWLLSRCHNVH
ncbi:helix-turn-helix transcriptional regulator [Yersinia vastinensis]|uniref:helix-turn-helix transcriptional regulator n=1 Tax=Yersinia vastinensis TaxID=2890318 RepID=UPI00119D35EC|nr:AlpA family phage regulatory protein [Yersinia vastinensis]